MEMIERYIYAVTRHLPEKQREDIAKELRSLIEDMIAEQMGEREATDNDVEAVLKTLGEPARLAAKYSVRPRYVIGPELFDKYIALLKITLPAVALAILVASIIRYISAPELIIGTVIGSTLGEILDAVIQVFAWLTAIFALVERFAADTIAKEWKKDDWDPVDLPDVPIKEAAFKRSETIVSIIFIFIFLIFLNFSAGQFSFYLPENNRTLLQIFNPSVLHSYLWLINICFGIEIVKEILKIVIGRYNLKLAIINTALGIAALILALIPFSNFNIWNQTFVQQLANAGVITLPANFDPAQPMLIGAKVVIGLIIFSFVSETAHMLFHTFRYGMNEKKK